jgi:phosphoribosylanthranilate isomerase
MTRVKICGLSREHDIEIVNAARPEYIGFVFAKSKRQVTPAFASTLRQKLAEGITAVGVFVNAETTDILQLVHDGTIDMIQLHGDEDEEYIHKLKSLTDTPIIKCGRSSAADYLLFDSAEAGSGKTFDWGDIGTVDKPFFLAGGLDCDNVTAAIEIAKPFAVDVSSGVETDGIKDSLKINEFIRRVRNG